MITYKCAKCGSHNIRQELSFFVNPNTFSMNDILDPNDGIWEDYFQCQDCESEEIEEINDDN